jgi:hypothetical protein
MNDERLSFREGRLSPRFVLRHVVIEGGSERAYDEEEWIDALVVVERGTVELEFNDRARVTFTAGDVLFLTGLPLCLLRNREVEPVSILAVARRRRGGRCGQPLGGARFGR